MNLIAAIMDKYDDLTASNFPDSSRPPIYHDEAAQVQTGQLRPPFTIISFQTGQADLTFESAETESNQLTFTVYYNDEEDLTTAISAIRWNGQIHSLNAGFDNGSLPNLSPATVVQMVIANAPTNFFDGLDYEVKNVYKCELVYDIMLELS